MWQTDRQTDRRTDGRTDRQTDGRTDWTIHRAAWSQLKIAVLVVANIIIPFSMNGFHEPEFYIMSITTHHGFPMYQAIHICVFEYYRVHVYLFHVVIFLIMPLVSESVYEYLAEYKYSSYKKVQQRPGWSSIYALIYCLTYLFRNHIKISDFGFESKTAFCRWSSHGQFIDHTRTNRV